MCTTNLPRFVKEVDEFKSLLEEEGKIVVAAFTSIGEQASTIIVLNFATLCSGYPEVKFAMVTSTAGSAVFEYTGVTQTPRFLIWKDGEKQTGPDITTIDQLKERLATVLTC